MKKLISYILVIMLVAALFVPTVAFAANEDGTEEQNPDNPPDTEPTPEKTPEPTPEKTPEPTPEKTPEPTPEKTPEPTPQEVKKPSVTVSVSPSELLTDGSVTLNISIYNTNSFNLENINISVNGKSIKSIGALKGGDTYTYTGKYSIKASELDKKIPVAVSYNGGSVSESFRVSQKAANITVNTISKVDKPSIKAGSEANFSFSIENKSDIAIEDVTLKASTLNEGKALAKEFSLRPGEAKIIAYSQVITETIDVAPVLTYTAADKSYSKNLDTLTVTVTEAEMTFTAKASATEMNAGEEVVFNLSLENTGNVDFTNIALYDANDSRITTQSNQLAAGAVLTAEHRMTFEESASVDFYVVAADAEGTSYTFRSNTIQINIAAADASDYSDLLTLTGEVSEDSVLLKKPGTANISLTLKNAHTEAFTDVKIVEANSGEIVETYSMFPTGEKVLTYSKDIETTTNFDFILTATDPEGNAFEYKLPTLNVPVKQESSGSNKLMTVIIILGVLAVLIIGGGVTLIVLVVKEKKKKQSTEEMRSAAVSDARRRNRTASAATHRRPAVSTAPRAEAPQAERRRPAAHTAAPAAAHTAAPQPLHKRPNPAETPVHKSYEHLKAEPAEEPIIVPPIIGTTEETPVSDGSDFAEDIAPEEADLIFTDEPAEEQPAPEEAPAEEPEAEEPAEAELQPLPRRKHRNFEDRNMF